MGEASRKQEVSALAQMEIDAGLGELRHHWGDAYGIDYDNHHGWRARRRDGRGEVLTGADPDEMFDVISADYRAVPVPRSCGPDE